MVLIDSKPKPKPKPKPKLKEKEKQFKHFIIKINNKMSDYLDINNHSGLLHKYDKYMLLTMFIDSDDYELKNKYLDAATKHNNKIFNSDDFIDAGFDLFAPSMADTNITDICFYKSPVNKVDFKVVCSAKMILDSGKVFNTGYYMYPRSSLSKTRLRLANSTGIIDSGYRGHLIGMFDLVNVPESEDCVYYGKMYDRYLQICAPGLVPIVVKIVETIEELGDQTDRAQGGFGSTGR